ncbi:MAG TPA: right-handed parallel beta-helix repeat-containing protein, partial [Mycobacteriales bacterium]|nr:right-handed parallel beta-helix repeat-containing protein [Mycobacteriales bacterium]
MTRDKSHRTRSVRRRAAGAAVLLAAPLALGVATPAHAVAETRYVAATGNDAVAAIPNDCSQSALPCRTIGHAVDEASSRDTVSIATGTYAESLNVTESLTFVGTGSTMPTITGDAGGDPTMWVDGDGASAPITVSLSDISLSGNTHAGALQVEAATTDLTDSKVSDNAGTGAFVTAGSTMTATGSTINGNLFGFYESGSLTLKNSTVSGSVMDGITVTGESVLITGSVISDSGGYGISQDGGAVSVTGSTISGNGKGGVVVGFNSAQPVTAHITRSTLSGNTVAGAAASPGGKVIITRSTVSGTRASTTGPQPYGGGLLAAGGNVQASEV